MSDAARGIGDNAILQRTEQIPDGNTIQLKFVLPSGQPMTSEQIPSDKLKAGVLMTWCENVRQAINDEAEEARALKQRDADLGDPPAQKAATEPPAGPEDFIRKALDGALREAHEAEKALRGADDRLTEAQENLEKWTKVAEGLGLTENTDDDED